MVVVLRVLAILAIIAGFILRVQGFPEGDSVIKFGMAFLVLNIVLSFFRISKHSRGTPL